MNGSELEYVNSYKYLSAWLDCSLSFHIYITHLQSKIKSRICFLYRNKASFTHSVKHTFVKMSMDYGDVVYRLDPKSIPNKLDVICHPLCYQLPFNTNHCDLYTLVNWSLIHTRHQTHWYQVPHRQVLSLPQLTLQNLHYQ